MNQNIRLRIQDYQALAKASFEFTPGINVIVGTNNVGKTSVFRALDAALFNRSDSNVKVGAEASVVGIEYRGHKVLWRRSSRVSGSQSKVTYMIDGEKYVKVGRGQLPIVAEMLGIYERKMIGRQIRLNFWDFGRPPFLMDSTASQVFEFFSTASEEGNLIEVVRSMRSDLTSMTSNINKEEGSLDTLKTSVVREKEFLSQMSGFDEIHQEIVGLEAQTKEHEALTQLVNRADESQINFEKLLVSCRQYVDLLDDIDPVLEVADHKSRQIITLEELISIVSENGRQLRTAREKIKIIEADSDTIDKLVGQLEVLSKSVTQADESKDLWHIIRAQESNLSKELGDVERALREFNICPLCGSSLEGDHEH